MFKLNRSFFISMCMFINLAYAETGKFIFQCEKLNESSKQASLIINFDLKKIELDSFEKRKKWEEFNDFLSKKNLPNYSYVADEYLITDVTSDDVIGSKKLLTLGKIKINRNSLMIYVEDVVDGKFIETSYKCIKSQKGF